MTQNRNPWPARLLTLAIILIAVVGVRVYITQPSTCSSCHTNAIQKRLNDSPHENVACIRCHGNRGVIAPVADGVTYTRWAWGYYIEQRKMDKGLSTHVDPQNCLSCHWSILSGVSQNAGIKVRHSDILDEGITCNECHSNVNHAVTSTKVSGPNMNQCLPCHNGKKAPSRCETCHVKDVAQSPTIEYEMRTAKVNITDTAGSCYKCHNEAPCIRCHGVRMPHPVGWGPSTSAAAGTGTSGTHARVGFTDREVCWRCHYAPGKPFQPSNEGCKCHNFLGTMHGGQPWVQEHGLQATGQKPGQLAECFICHDSLNFCTLCHPASYNARYAPVVGPDNYPRQYQPTPAEQAIINSL